MILENIQRQTPENIGREGLRAGDGKNVRLGILFTIVATVAFGTEAIAAKLAYRSGATVITALAVRYLVAALAFWAAVGLRRIAWRLPRRQVTLILVLTLAGHVTTVTALFYAFSYITAGMAILLLYLYPAVVTLLAAVFLHEPLTWRKGLALVLTFGGAAVILGLPFEGFDARGVIFAVAAALFNAGFYVAGARLVRDVPVAAFNTYVVSFAAAFFLVLGLLTGEFRGALSPAAWGWLVYLGLVVTALALEAMFKGITLIGASRASIIATLEPAVTALLGFWVLGESLTGLQMAGGVLILAGVLLQARE